MGLANVLYQSGPRWGLHLFVGKLQVKLLLYAVWPEPQMFRALTCSFGPRDLLPMMLSAY